MQLVQCVLFLLPSIVTYLAGDTGMQLVQYVLFLLPFIVANLGHGRSGEVSYNHSELLQRSSWRHYHLWYYKGRYFQPCAPMDRGCEEICWWVQTNIFSMALIKHFPRKIMSVYTFCTLWSVIYMAFWCLRVHHTKLGWSVVVGLYKLVTQPFPKAVANQPK